MRCSNARRPRSVPRQRRCPKCVSETLRWKRKVARKPKDHRLRAISGLTRGRRGGSDRDRHHHFPRPLEAERQRQLFSSSKGSGNPRQHHVESARLEPNRRPGGNVDGVRMTHFRNAALDEAPVKHGAGRTPGRGPNETIRTRAAVGDREVDGGHRRPADGGARPSPFDREVVGARRRGGGGRHPGADQGRPPGSSREPQTRSPPPLHRPVLPLFRNPHSGAHASWPFRRGAGGPRSPTSMGAFTSLRCAL